MTEMTDRFALPLLQPGQAQKEMFHNEALSLLDAALHPVATAFATDDVPADPASGTTWIVGGAAGGAWTGRTGWLATWTAGGWRFVRPVPGMTIWVTAESRWVWHDGIAWRDGPLPTAGVTVAGKRVIGERQAAILAPTTGPNVDVEARDALVAVLSALRAHGLIEQ